MKTLKRATAIEANSIYGDGKLAATDSTVTIPAVTYQTAEVQAMGSMNVPLLGLLEDMELSITKIGVDKNISTLVTAKKIEVRWVQDVVDTDGTVSQGHCKAFFRVLPKVAAPEAGIELASAPEGAYTYTVTRQQLFIDGDEVFLVDRLAKKLVINGKDMLKKWDNWL